MEGGLDKARDPLFGLAMGQESQVSNDSFRFYTAAKWSARCRVLEKCIINGQ